MVGSSRDRRSLPRAARSLGCELRIAGKTYTGVVLDLSAQGLFVRTNWVPEPGSALELTVRRPGGEVWTLWARVARGVPRGAAMLSRRGVGLELVEAPDAYHRFVSELLGDAATH